MNEASIRSAFAALAKAALGVNSESEGDFPNYQGLSRIAYYDQRSDQRFTSLPEFSPAELALRNLEVFRERFGDSESVRVTLQFVYELLSRIDGPDLEDGPFDEFWTDFSVEIENPDWTYYSVTNLQNFEADFSILELDDGISIRGRDFGELRDLLGWGDFELEAMTRDWMHGGSSSYILLVEHKVPKTPENIVLSNTLESSAKASNILLAMRLLKPGDVRIGPIWYSRRAQFKLIGGMSSTGTSQWNPGKRYLLTTADKDSLLDRYRLLGRLQTKLEAKLPNIALALRTFSSIYERSFQQGKDRVVDGITALEALLPTNVELAFKLAYRVAGLLASDDDSRVTYFDNMKAYYQTRSKIVHGLSLNNKDRELIRNDEPIRSVVRQILMGFLHLAESTQITVEKSFYEKRLDVDLLHAGKRSELRDAMKLA